MSLSAATLLIFHFQPHRPMTHNDAPIPARDNNDQSPSQFEAPDDALIFGEMVFPALTLTTANTKLRKEETSMVHHPGDTATNVSVNVSRYDSVRLPSNSPCEDERCYTSIKIDKDEEWKCWGVFDGHGGWTTSHILRDYLPSYISHTLSKAKATKAKTNPDTTLTDAAIDQAIKLGFTNLDNEIIDQGLRALTDASLTHSQAVSRIAACQSGSCALVALFNPKNGILKVACTGDSRAVLGRRRRERTSPTSPVSSWESLSEPTASTTNANVSSNSTQPQDPDPVTVTNTNSDTTSLYSAHALSQDQTGFNSDEVSRLTTLHPNEPEILSPTSGRLLGLAITRAFGDHRWKWPLSSIETAKTRFYSTNPRPNYATPPYLTAEPVITSTEVRNGDFLILASDGFWDHVENELAVLIVEKWLARRHTQTQVSEETATMQAARESQVPFTWEYEASKENVVVEYENVASCLARNALGGKDEELFCSALSTRAPNSREFRDDITISVVFFGDVDA